MKISVTFLPKPNFGIFSLCMLIFYNAYPWRYFFYFEFRQKVHIVYFWPHLLFGAQNFRKNWNVVPYSYCDVKVLISGWWRSYKTRKLKKFVFSNFFKSNLVVHRNEHVKYYISTCIRPMTTKHGNIVTFIILNNA